MGEPVETRDLGRLNHARPVVEPVETHDLGRLDRRVVQPLRPFGNRPYKEAGARERFAYHLTPAGDALLPVLGSLIQWGDEYRRTDHGPTRVYRSATTGEPLHVAFVTASGEIVPDADIEIVPGPGERNAELPAVRPLAHA